MARLIRIVVSFIFVVLVLSLLFTSSPVALALSHNFTIEWRTQNNPSITSRGFYHKERSGSGAVYASDNDGYLRKYSAKNGSSMWNLDLNEGYRPYNSGNLANFYDPQLHGGTGPTLILAGTWCGRKYYAAVNAATGVLAWTSQSTATCTMGQPAVLYPSTDGVPYPIVIFPMLGYFIYHPANGSLISSFEASPTLINANNDVVTYTMPFPNGTKSVLAMLISARGTYVGHTWCIDVTNPARPKQVWLHSMLSEGSSYSARVMKPTPDAAPTDRLLLFSAKHAQSEGDYPFIALNVINGTRAWKLNNRLASRVCFCEPLGLVFLGGAPGTQYENKTFAVRARDGAQIWETDLGGMVGSYFPCAMVAAEPGDNSAGVCGYLVVGGRPHLYMLDPETGTLLGSYDLGIPAVSPALSASRRDFVFDMSTDGERRVLYVSYRFNFGIYAVRVFPPPGWTSRTREMTETEVWWTTLAPPTTTSATTTTSPTTTVATTTATTGVLTAKPMTTTTVTTGTNTVLTTTAMLTTTTTATGPVQTTPQPSPPPPPPTSTAMPTKASGDDGNSNANAASHNNSTDESDHNNDASSLIIPLVSVVIALLLAILLMLFFWRRGQKVEESVQREQNARQMQEVMLAPRPITSNNVATGELETDLLGQRGGNSSRNRKSPRDRHYVPVSAAAVFSPEADLQEQLTVLRDRHSKNNNKSAVAAAATSSIGANASVAGRDDDFDSSNGSSIGDVMFQHVQQKQKQQQQQESSQGQPAKRRQSQNDDDDDDDLRHVDSPAVSVGGSEGRSILDAVAKAVHTQQQQVQPHTKNQQQQADDEGRKEPVAMPLAENDQALREQRLRDFMLDSPRDADTPRQQQQQRARGNSKLSVRKLDLSEI